MFRVPQGSIWALYFLIFTFVICFLVYVNMIVQDMLMPILFILIVLV